MHKLRVINYYILFSTQHLNEFNTELEEFRRLEQEYCIPVFVFVTTKFRVYLKPVFCIFASGFTYKICMATRRSNIRGKLIMVSSII